MTETIGNTGRRIAVIGGGASGCMAAIAAAQAGCHVTLFEKNDKIAKKIYATGNGRCNLTNLFLDASCYHTQQDIDFSRIFTAIEKFTQYDLILFFREAGIPVHDRDGYVYPRTDQAETVVRALEKCLRQSAVEIFTSSTVLGIEKENGAFCVRYKRTQEGKAADGCRGRKAEKTAAAGRCVKAEKAEKKAFPSEKKSKTGDRGKKKDSSVAAGTNAAKPAVRKGEREETFSCDCVILCTGGMAGPSFGCSGDGYRFAEHFAHSVISPLPALTRLECGEPLLRRAAGVRCHASVTLLEDTGAGPMRSYGSEDGELQITENSISGIPVFQISGMAAKLLSDGHRVLARIDFLPEFSKEDFEEEKKWRLRRDRGQMLSDFFLGLAHRKVIDLILAREGLQAEMKARRFSDEELQTLMDRFRCFELEVTATGGFDHAQVTSGGVPLTETDDSFASLKCQGLYLAGELIDVDGRCGGYNLQWAMTSGFLAGRAAASFTQEK